MSSHSPPGRISLRAPPHLPFIQGYPGIPSSGIRRPAAIHGTVEIRVGAQPIKAKWVRVEIRKHETIPPGFPISSNGSSSSSSGPGSADDRSTWEHVGEINTLWSPNPKLNKEFDTLETADFKFYIPLPDTMPPSVDMVKGSGIRYELVAACCYKQKGGMFKKESAAVMKTVETLVIIKHELHSAWPLYNIPDSFTSPPGSGNSAVNLSVQRPYSAFGPGDRLLLTAVLHSNRPTPFKVKGFECTLFEVVTVTDSTPPTEKRKSKKPHPPTTKSRIIATTRYPIDESVGRGGEKSARLEMPIPTDKVLVTVRTAKSIEISYEVEVKAVCDGIPETVLRGIKYIVGPFGRSHAQQAVRDIGNFPPLCPGVGGSRSSNPPSSRPGSPTNLTRSPSASSSPPPKPFIPNSISPGPTPSPQPPSSPFGVVDYPPGFSGHPLARPPVQGFQSSRMAEDPRRKSSSTLTSMTTMTTATHDFAPTTSMNQTGQSGSAQFQNQRGYSTMPNQRLSMPVAAAYSNNLQGGLTRSPSYGSSIHHPTSPPIPAVNDYSPNFYPVQESGNGGGNDEWRSKRFSSATNMTFGPMPGRRDGLEPLAEHDTTRTASPAPSHSGQHPSFPSPMIPMTNSNPLSAWQTAETEKKRLYDEARNRAAAAQLQSGVSMAEIGMDAPPEYYPPQEGSSSALHSGAASAAGAVSSNSFGNGNIITSNSVETPSHSRSIPEPESTSSPRVVAVNGTGFGSGSAPQPASYISAADEKAQQRQRYEEAQSRASALTSASGLGMGESKLSANMGVPTATGPVSVPRTAPADLSQTSIPAVRVSSPVPGGGGPGTGTGSRVPSSSGNAMGSGPTYLSAEEEKAIQRRRYEEATSKTSNPQGAIGDSGGVADDRPPSFAAASATASGPGPADRSGEVAPTPASMPWTYLSAAEEKELQKKRFEDARLRVSSPNPNTNHHQGGGGGGWGNDRSGATSPAFSVTTMGTTRPQDENGPVPYDSNTTTTATATATAANSAIPTATATTTNSSGTPNTSTTATPRHLSIASIGGPGQDQYDYAQPPPNGRDADLIPGFDGQSGINAKNPPYANTDINTNPFRQSARPAATPAVPSALDEKAQMKRYYEALDKVERTQGGSSGSSGNGAGIANSANTGNPIGLGNFGNPSQSPAPAPALGTSNPATQPGAGNRNMTVLSAAEEKEQMKRYYQAVDRVEKTQSGSGGGGSGGSGTANNVLASNIGSGSAGYGADNGSSGLQQQQQGRMGSLPNGNATSAFANPNANATATPQKPTAGMGLSAAQEKEQMKRYYEAVDRVERAHTGGESGGSGSGSGFGFGAGGGLGTGSGSGSGAGSRSGAAFSGNTNDMAIPNGIMSPIPYDEVPPIDNHRAPIKPSTAGPISSPKASSSSSTGTLYLSAAEEKEQMKRRFEAAQSAVQAQSQQSPSSGQGGSSRVAQLSSPTPRDTHQSIAQTAPVSLSNPITGHTPAGTSTSTSTTGSPSTPLHQHQRSSSAQTSRLDPGSATKATPTRQLSRITDPISVPADAPPPPLPARPPTDYITLLRPADQSGPRGT